MKKKGKRRSKRRKFLDRTISVRQIVWFIVIAAVAFGTVQFWKSPIPRALRDLAFAVVANHRAGDDIPIDLEYTGSAQWKPNASWNIQVNSEWVARYVTKIVPYFQYDKVTDGGRYPQRVIFIPIEDSRSFHLGGSASATYGIIVINERYATDPRWNDARSLLATLTHELIHLQRANFITGTSMEVEAHTQAATLEILGGMCNYGDELACKSFWYEVTSLSAASLRTSLNEMRVGWMYDILARIFWRDAADAQAARKANRFWGPNSAERAGIISRYGAYPWNQYVLPGLWGVKLNTGHRIIEPIGISSYIVKELGMPFDDTADLMGLFLRLLALIR